MLSLHSSSVRNNHISMVLQIWCIVKRLSYCYCKNSSPIFIWYNDITSYSTWSDIKCSLKWCDHSYDTHIETQCIYRCMPHSATDQRTNLHDIFAHLIYSQHYHVCLEFTSLSTMQKNVENPFAIFLKSFFLKIIFLDYKNNDVDF